LEVLDETTDSVICFGDEPIRTLGKFFNMTPEIVQQCICSFRFVLSSEPITALKSKSDLKPLLDVVDTLLISAAECERSFSSMNDVFTSTRNSLLLKAVSRLILLENNGPPLQHYRSEGFVWSLSGKGRRHADVTASRSLLTEKIKVEDPLEWKLCGSNVSNS
jgi:hypothetical protein